MARRSWDRRPRETQRAYDAFLVFLGDAIVPGVRDTAEVARAIGEPLKAVRDWCYLYQWHNRAADYDAYLAKQYEKDIEILQRRWRHGRLRRLKRMTKTTTDIQGIIEKMCEWPIGEVRPEYSVDEQGRTVITRWMTPSFSLRDIALMLKLNIDALERLEAVIQSETAVMPGTQLDEDVPSEVASAAMKELIRIMEERGQKALT